MTINRQILLVSRPKGEATLDNFHLAAPELPELGDGQVLVRNFYLSLDPYMRGRMNDTKSYAPPQPLDAVMVGATVGEVIESRHPDWQPGDAVTAMFGWQEYGISDGSNLRRVDAVRVPMSVYLGAAGMPGVTAWYGLNKIIAPKAGQTVAVSAASGAVGSVVGQLAKRMGCRVVGIAGGRRSVPMSPKRWASMRASTTRRAISTRRCVRPHPTVSTATSRTWVARCSMPCWATSTPIRASRCAA